MARLHLVWYGMVCYGLVVGLTFLSAFLGNVGLSHLMKLDKVIFLSKAIHQNLQLSTVYKFMRMVTFAPPSNPPMACLGVSNIVLHICHCHH